MKNGNGIPMPKKRDNSYGANYEELSSVKNLDGKVLMMHSVVTSEKTILDNLNWRIRTFESFRKKVENVAEDYTGGIDLDSIQINDPVILELEEFEGDLKPEEPQVIVNFTAVIPTNIGRKELH
tara:strand:+ start:294 stop:665 length:372 start_codon:yes stop_codon:yes gene_type:complete